MRKKLSKRKGLRFNIVFSWSSAGHVKWLVLQKEKIFLLQNWKITAMFYKIIHGYIDSARLWVIDSPEQVLLAQE